MARLSGVGEALADVWLAAVGTFVRRTPAVPADMLRRKWSGGARSVRSRNGWAAIFASFGSSYVESTSTASSKPSASRGRAVCSAEERGVT